MNSNTNLPSVIECISNTRSFELINEYLIIGNDKGYLEIYDWENEKKQFVHNLFDKEVKLSDNDNYKQIINIDIIDNQSKTIAIQCRGGDLFIGQINESTFTLITAIQSKIETFSKCSLSFNEEIRKINNNSHYNTNISWKCSILLPEEKENFIKIIEISTTYQEINNYSHKIYLEKDENIQDDDSDEDEDPNKKSLINNILINSLNPFIVITFESSILSLFTHSLSFITSSQVFQNKNEAIITVNTIKIKEIIYIIIGLFSTNLAIFSVDAQNNLSIFKTLSNVCSDLKCGISSIAYTCYIKEDFFGESNQEVKLLMVGGYDKRVKCYQIDDNTQIINFKDLGNIVTGGSGVINQIKIAHNQEGNTFLFVCKEQRLFYIYPNM